MNQMYEKKLIIFFGYEICIFRKLSEETLILSNYIYKIDNFMYNLFEKLIKIT